LLSSYLGFGPKAEWPKGPTNIQPNWLITVRFRVNERAGGGVRGSDANLTAFGGTFLPEPEQSFLVPLAPGSDIVLKSRTIGENFQDISRRRRVARDCHLERRIRTL